MGGAKFQQDDEGFTEIGDVPVPPIGNVKLFGMPLTWEPEVEGVQIRDRGEVIVNLTNCIPGY
jgi:hypothetical protein